jgi:glutamyl-tRNA reductase
MLVLVGLNHRSAPVAIRERLAFAEDKLPAALRGLRDEEGIDEVVILSTCNRVEIMVRSPEGIDGSAIVREFLAREREIPAGDLDGHLYQYINDHAVRHLYRVACGLDSMILGEPQILGQLKRAYAMARAAGTTGPILDHLFQRGFATAKQVRTETGISRYAVSIAFAAVELARKIFGDLKGRSVLVVGSGKMAELATTHLVANGIEQVTVTSRTFDHAENFAMKFGGEAVRWEKLGEKLAEVDVVVSGTAAPGVVLDEAEVARALRKRRGRSLFIIDIAVPRDVEPSVNKLNHVYLYDIDDLQGVVEHNINERKRAAASAHRMVEKHGEAFQRWNRGLRMTPTIVALRETIMNVRRQEHDRHRRKLADLTPEQAEAVEALTHGIVQKVLHSPIRYLKTLGDRGDAAEYAAIYREIFGLPEDGDETSSDGPDEPDDADGPSPLAQAE